MNGIWDALSSKNFESWKLWTSAALLIGSEGRQNSWLFWHKLCSSISIIEHRGQGGGVAGGASPAAPCCWLGNISIRNLPSILVVASEKIRMRSGKKRENGQSMIEGHLRLSNSILQFHNELHISFLAAWIQPFWVPCTLIKCSPPMWRCSRFFGTKTTKVDFELINPLVYCHVTYLHVGGSYFSFLSQLVGWLDMIAPLLDQLKDRKMKKVWCDLTACLAYCEPGGCTAELRLLGPH